MSTPVEMIEIAEVGGELASINKLWASTLNKLKELTKDDTSGRVGAALRDYNLSMALLVDKVARGASLSYAGMLPMLQLPAEWFNTTQINKHTAPQPAQGNSTGAPLTMNGQGSGIAGVPQAHTNLRSTSAKPVSSESKSGETVENSKDNGKAQASGVSASANVTHVNEDVKSRLKRKSQEDHERMRKLHKAAQKELKGTEN